MNIIITGATGFVGKRLVHKLIERGHQPFALTRNKKKASDQLPGGCEILEWSPGKESSMAFDTNTLNTIQGAINLAGENISEKRWTDQQKQKIKNSRVNVTSNLVDLLQKHSPECQVLVSASAIGYYPVNITEEITEETSSGDGFLADICQQWEREAQNFPSDKRTVISRIGVVLGPEGGALFKLLPIFNLGLGGKVGSGQQMMSWIHVDDLVDFLIHGVENENLNGVYNAVAPQPVTNEVFSKSLAKALGRPAIFPVPAIALKVAMGEMSTIVLDSQKISSAKIQQTDFQFKFSDIESAMQDIVHQYKS